MTTLIEDIQSLLASLAPAGGIWRAAMIAPQDLQPPVRFRAESHRIAQ